MKYDGSIFRYHGHE